MVQADNPIVASAPRVGRPDRLRVLGLAGGEFDLLQQEVQRHGILLGKLAHEVGLGNVLVGIEDPTLTIDIATHAALGDVHHAEIHVLATTGPHSGMLPWADLNKTGSSLADLVTRPHSDLASVTSDQHHAQAHAPESHTGTDITAAELEDLSDGGESALHSHAGGGGGYSLIRDEGVDETARANVNFIGGLVFAQDDAGAALETEIHIGTQPDGTNLFTTADAAPFLTLLKQTRFDAPVGIQIGPHVTTLLNVNASGTPTGNYGNIESQGAITIDTSNRAARFVAGFPVVDINAGLSDIDIRGLSFGVISRALADTATVRKHHGVEILMETLLSFGTVTNMRGGFITAPIIVAPKANHSIITTAGFEIEDMSNSAKQIDAYGLKIAYHSGTNPGFNRLVEVRPAIPYFRILGAVTAVAQETPVFISWGTAAPAWALKQLKTVTESALDTASGTKEICYLV